MMIDKITESLTERLGEWECTWWHPSPGREYGMSPWLMDLHHPKGLKLSDAHMEHERDIKVTVGDDAVHLHKGEQAKLNAVWKRVEERLQKTQDITLREHNDQLRIKAMGIVEKL